jgi:hypothetical protein
VTPYYEDERVVIYHADCRDCLPSMSGYVLVCDPPYGVELGTGDARGRKHGLAKAAYASYTDTLDEFETIVLPAIGAAVERCVRGAVFVGKHITMWPAPDAYGGVYCPATTGRNKWGYSNFAPVFFYGTNPTLQHGAKHTVLVSTEASEKNGHPCPKPIGWMRWLVGRTALPGECVVDPFMGSGTTLVAAKALGCRAIGIEIEERYCELAARRVAQGVLEFADAGEHVQTVLHSDS